jgi:hypothetical protein
MLETYQNARKSRQENIKTLTKLVERVNLDRPIMQKEKIDLILLEKLKNQPESADKDLKADEIRE